MKTRAIPNQTFTTINGKTISAWPISLSNPGGSRTDGRPAFLKRSLKHIKHCRMPWKTASTLLAAQAMQTNLLPILPPQRQEYGIQTSSPTLRAMATIKIFEFSSVPSDKSLSQAALSFSDPPHATYYPNFTQVIGKWSTTTSPLPRLHIQPLQVRLCPLS